MIIFESFGGLLRVVVMAITAYVALIGALRIAGKRSLSKLNAFDLVVTVAIGSILATTLLNKSVPLFEGVLAFTILLLLQWMVARLSITQTWFRDAVRSEPRILFENGVMNESGLRHERLTRGEVEAAIRSSGIGSTTEVAAVVLETDGTLSVVAKSGSDDDLTAKLAR